MIKKRFVFLFVFCSILAKNSSADLPKSADESGIDHVVSWKAYVLKKGDGPDTLFAKNATQAMRFNRLSKKFWKPGVIIKRPDDLSFLKNWTPMPLEYDYCAKKKICVSKFKTTVVIDLKQQYLGVYRYGKLKMLEGKELKEKDFTYVSFSVSTGTSAKECKDKKTHTPIGCETPAGLYQIKAKYNKRFSSLYKVWMQYAVCIEGGRCLHKGDLPGYPASHGCIRLLGSDAYYLYKRIPGGTYVFIVSSTEK
jgi:hypothetical protein